MRRAGWPAVALAAGAVALGACGGENAKRPEPAAPPAARAQQQDYIARADRACLRFRREHQGDRARSAAAQARDTRMQAARTLDELRRLDPPAQDRAVLERYFALIEQQVRLDLPKLERAAREKDVATAQRVLDSIRARGAEAGRLAQAYGFKVCGRAASRGPRAPTA